MICIKQNNMYCDNLYYLVYCFFLIVQHYYIITLYRTTVNQFVGLFAFNKTIRP